jgi:DNA-binding NtrC family response regulator
MKKKVILCGISANVVELIDEEKYNVSSYKNLGELPTDIKTVDIVIVDLGDKLCNRETFSKIKQLNPNMKILGIVSVRRVRVATKLLKNNLDDFLIKNDRNSLLSINEKIENLLNNNLNSQDEVISMYDLINSDEKIKKNLSVLKKIASTKMSILIQGECGCEHDLYAKAIHKLSNRKNNEFLFISCSNLDKKNIKDIYKSAADIDGGTIFLDKVDIIKYELQIALSNVIDEINNKYNIRIISSSTKNLENEVKDFLFLGNLYFTISEYVMTISPLREMRNFIPLLVKNLYQYFSAEENKNITGITGRALKTLESHNWFGNIKEMKNTIYKAVILNKNGILDVKDFPDLVRKKDNISKNDNISLINCDGQYKTMEILEKEIIDNYLKIFKGNMTKVSEVLDIGRATLYRKLDINSNDNE